MTQGSTRVVLAALAGNGAIALAKFGAAWLSGSTAMLTEAVHSLVDTGDQFLLLAGQARGRKAPDESHPLGYGMETYFWSFIVALMVFLTGGVVGIYQGVRHILHPAQLSSPWLGFGVLAFSALFEGSSFAVAFREFRRMVRGRQVGLWTFIRISKDPSLFSTLLEDGAALIGIGLAALGLAGSSLAHIPWADGAASTAIGLLLMCVSGVLANETRSLIAGEAVAPPVMVRLRAVLAAEPRIAEPQLCEVTTLHLGPQAILVALTLRWRPGLTAAEADATLRDLTVALKGADDRIAYVYARPPEG